MKLAKNIFSIPNILSFIRVGLIPFIVASYFWGKIYLTAILIVLSGLTDIVDGFIARKFNMITPLGKALDPIADKLTLFSLLVCVCIKNLMVLGLLVIFVIKEILMGIEGLYIIKYTGTTYSAKWYGKLSTCLLYISILIMILWVGITFKTTLFLIILCGASVVLAFILYTITNLSRIKKLKNQTK